MGKFQIFPDGRAAGSAPVSGSDFVNLDTLNSSSVWVKSTGSPSAVLFAKAGNDNQATASGQYAVAFGIGNKVNGIKLIASGVASFAHGYGTNADGRYSHAEGQQSWASNIAAHAEGHSSARGYASHAEGISTVAVASGSHAEGYNTVASGSFSHAEGKQTIAFAEAAHAEGLETTASANYSHAEGRNTLVSAEGAHAEGYFTEASGTYSHAEGLHTKTTNQSEHAQGWYNATGSGQLFSIGVGDAEARRKNAVSVRTGGTVYIYGVGGYLGSGSVSGAESVQSVISSLTGSIASASYNSTDKKIYFFNAGGTASAEIDATDFIKDGMVDSVEVSGSYLVLTFNTDAGKEPVSMSLTRIFNPDNFYTKTDVDTLLSTMSVGDVNVIEAVEFNGTASTINNKTASINVELPAAPNQDAENWVTENSASFTRVEASASLAKTAVQPADTASLAASASLWKRGTGSSSIAQAGTPECKASNNKAIAIGNATHATGVASFAMGQQTSASGDTGFAEGWFTVAAGAGSHAEGYKARAGEKYSHAEGEYVTASGQGSHAEGNKTQAKGGGSHAEGTQSIAQGSYSHAEGYGTITSGSYSHAEGRSTVAYQYGSHAEGSGSFASGTASHAEGYRTTASANYSHAEGFYTLASGSYSHAEGSYTVTTNTGEHAQGQYNRTESNQIFSIGVGDTEARRKNAISIVRGITPSASIYIYGVGTYDGTNPQPGVNDVATVISASAGGSEPLFIDVELGVSGNLPSGTYNAALEAYHAGRRVVVRDTASYGDITILAEMVENITNDDAWTGLYFYPAFPSYDGTYGYAYHVNPDYYVPELIQMKGSYQVESWVTYNSASVRSSSNWVTNNSASLVTEAATASWDTAASQSHTHSNGSLLNSLTNAKTGSWDGAATWVTANSSSALAVSPASVTASINAAIGGITASHHTHSNKAVLDSITAAKTASWDSAATSATALNSISASLIASGTLAKNVTAITASLVASASVAKTASSSAAAISAKTASWDALVGLPAVTAADNGKILRVVNGAWALVDPVTVYSGQGAPDSALGQDGDIYLQS